MMLPPDELDSDELDPTTFPGARARAAAAATSVICSSDSSQAPSPLTARLTGLCL